MSAPSRDDVARWAEESGVCWIGTNGNLYPGIREDCDMLEEVEKLVAMAYAAGQAAEREACAVTCETLRFSPLGPTSEAQHQRNLCAKAIRARGD